MTQPPHHLFHTGFINSVKQGCFGSIMMSQHTSKNSNQMIRGKKKHMRVVSKCYPGKEPSVQNSNLLLKFCAFMSLQLVFVVSGVKGHLKMAPDLLQREREKEQVFDPWKPLKSKLWCCENSSNYGWMRGVRLTYLPLQTAAAQLLVFSLETLGFSQDGVDLEVDHVGRLPSNRNGKF